MGSEARKTDAYLKRVVDPLHSLLKLRRYTGEEAEGAANNFVSREFSRKFNTRTREGSSHRF